MLHVKAIMSVAVSMARYVSALQCTTAALPADSQLILAAGDRAHGGPPPRYSEAAMTPKGDQDRDRVRLRLDPLNTPNPEPPGR